MSEYDKHYSKYKRNRERQLFYQSAAWAKARELALKRDNYLCQSCLSKKKIQKAEVVHHIREFADYPELSTTLDNLVSWCHSCHSKHHKSGVRKKKEIKRNIPVIKVKSNSEQW